MCQRLFIQNFLWKWANLSSREVLFGNPGFFGTLFQTLHWQRWQRECLQQSIQLSWSCQDTETPFAFDGNALGYRRPGVLDRVGWDDCTSFELLVPSDLLYCGYLRICNPIWISRREYIFSLPIQPWDQLWTNSSCSSVLTWPWTATESQRRDDRPEPSYSTPASCAFTLHDLFRVWLPAPW